MLFLALLPLLLLLSAVPRSSLAQVACVPNRDVCSTCPPDRQWKVAGEGTLSCCPHCASFLASDIPRGDRGPCQCPELDPSVAGNWSIPEYTGPQYPSIEAKVISSGSKRPSPANTFDKPSLAPDSGGYNPGYAPRPPTYPDFQRYADAINAIAQALDNLGGQVIDMQKKLDYLLERDRFLLSESTISVHRVGAPHAPANELNTNKIINPSESLRPPAQNRPPRYPPQATTTSTTTTTTTTTPKPYIAPTSSAPPPFAGFDNGGCSSAFERVGEHCYYLSVRDYHRANWQEAYDSCKRRGAVLATLDSPKSFSDLARHLSSSATTASYRFWLGGLFPGVKWHWVYSGEEVTLKKSQWTTSTSNSLTGARSQARSMPDLFDASNDNPILKSVLQNITRVINRNSKQYGGLNPVEGRQQALTFNDSLGDVENSTLQPLEETWHIRKERQAIISSSPFRTRVETQRENASPLVSLLNPTSRAENSQFASRDFREPQEGGDGPWAVSNGRCLLFQSVTEQRTFKFAADQCGYDQYYICQDSNEI